MSISTKAAELIALAGDADDAVTALAGIMASIAAKENELRLEVINTSGLGVPALPQRAGLANYCVTLTERLVAGETRPAFVATVEATAAADWSRFL